MITALKKYDGICFQCRDFRITHGAEGYEIMRLGGDLRYAAHPSITVKEALEIVNNYLGINL